MHITDTSATSTTVAYYTIVRFYISVVAKTRVGQATITAITSDMARQMHARELRAWGANTGTHVVVPVEVEAPGGGGDIDDDQLLHAALATQHDIVAVKVHQAVGDARMESGTWGTDIAGVLLYVLLFIAIVSLCAL